MKNQITIREAVTENDVAAFWEQLHAYHKRDIFMNSDKEELEYFLGSEYHDHMMNIYGRPQNRCFFLFFHRGGQDIGFAMPVIFTTEDGKCFIMEFCVYPEFRGSGTGKACAGTLLYWAKEHGARYAELNYGGNERRRHFWESMGFIENGADEWGEPLMLLPPEENFPITAKLLADPDDWQLKKLENGFLKEIGEAPSTKEKQEQLAQAIRDSEIYREYRRQSERVDNAGNMREKIDEYRIRNFELQNSAYTEDLLDKMEAFEREYEKFREDPLVEEFLDAELAFCRMMQEIDVKLAEAVDFE